MKFFQATVWLLLGIIFCPPLSSTAQAQVNPWPWEKELPFPWDNIEGIWGGIHDGETMLFSFEIIVNPTGHRQIRVIEVDPETMEIIATGPGVENNNVLRAVLVGRKYRFKMSVRLIENDYCVDNRQHTVITIENIGRESFIFHFTVEKITNSPLTPPTNSHYKLDNFSINTFVNSMCFF